MQKSIEAKRSEALMQWLSQITSRLRSRKGAKIGDHVYVVGGAVRDYLLGRPIKDIDLVIDSIALHGYNSEHYAKDIKNNVPVGTKLVTDNYGVAKVSIQGSWKLPLEDEDGNTEQVDMKGEVIEIATARSESYDEGAGDLEGKGYKPTAVAPTTIEQDVLRREFTFNTLMWRMNDLVNGFDQAEVIDMTGKGVDDLRDGRVRTPVDPDKTFADDPSRMVRAVKFMSRYGWDLEDDVVDSILRNRDTLLDVPPGAVANMLLDTVFPFGDEAIKILKLLTLLEPIAKIYQNDAPFRATMEGWMANEDPKKVVRMLNAGLPFIPPWANLPFAEGKNEGEYRDVILRASDPVTFLETIKQPTKALGDKRWFIDASKQLEMSPKDFGPILRETAAAILLQEPDLALQSGAFREALEEVLFNS